MLTETQIIVERMLAVCLALTGLSHFLQPQSWIDFFRMLHRQGHPGVLVNALLTAPFGALIVCAHNVWSWPAVLITLLGWLYVLKATVIACAPRLGLRSMALVERKGVTKMRVAGCLLVLCGGLIGWHAGRAAAGNMSPPSLPVGMDSQPALDSLLSGTRSTAGSATAARRLSNAAS